MALILIHYSNYFIEHLQSDWLCIDTEKCKDKYDRVPVQSNVIMNYKCTLSYDNAFSIIHL